MEGDLMAEKMLHPEKTGRKAVFVAAMLQSQTIKEAARRIGITDAAAYRLSRDPECKAMLEQAKNASIEAATQSLQGSLSLAVDALREVVANTSTAPATRVYAAQMLLQHGLAYTKAAEVEQRLRALEDLSQEEAPERVRRVPLGVEGLES